MHSEGQGDDSSQEEGIPRNPPKASLQSKGITVEMQVSFSAPHADPTVHMKNTHTTRQEGKTKQSQGDKPCQTLNVSRSLSS